MNWRDLRLRLRALLAPRRAERELDEELSFHLEMETRKHLAAGLGAEAARTRAQSRFGSIARAAEACRDARGLAWVDHGVQDVGYALRTFRRAPAVALTIVGTVAIGLGLVAVAFSIFNVFVLRADAVHDPGTLVGVAWAPSGGSSGRFGFNLRQYEALRLENDVFADVAARRVDITLRIEGRLMDGQVVTGNFFQALGVGVALGRTLTPADDSPSAERQAIVISHRCWQELFQSDPHIVGRTLRVNGFVFEVVGVTPEGFRGLDAFAADYWAPLAFLNRFRTFETGDNPGGLEVIGRLKPGVSRSSARAGLVVWASRTASALPVNQRPEDIRLLPKSTATPLSPSVLLAFSPLFGVFGLILVIGCANVANLLMARAVARQREIGIRLSLGASRGRVVRQLLTESLLLALASAACGHVLAHVAIETATRVLLGTMPPELAELIRVAPPSPDLRVAGFLVITAAFATAFFGLAPALQATRLDLVRVMRGEPSRPGPPSRARNTLIAVQVTASALLLIVSGILLRGALRAADADPGVRMADTVIIAFEERSRSALVAAVAADPLVTAVAASWPDAPLLGQARGAFAMPAGSTSRSAVEYRFVSQRYFDVLGIDVLSGRAFTEAESRTKAEVVILSDATARRLWPGGHAVGQILRLEPDMQAVRRDEAALPATTALVVGVVRDVAGFRLGWPEAGVYLPFDVTGPRAALIARVQGDPDAARRTLLDRLTSIDPNLGMVVTMRTLGRLETYPLQVGFWITVLLGLLALLLTASGIYGVLSYVVAQRAQEIGVRLAIGATAGAVVRMVLGQSLRIVAVGLCAGVGLAWAAAVALMATPAAARINGLVDVTDEVVYAGSLLFIVIASLIAAAVPALRASRIDPAATLRQD